jgi:hypothetical protein
VVPTSVELRTGKVATGRRIKSRHKTGSVDRFDWAAQHYTDERGGRDPRWVPTLARRVPGADAGADARWVRENGHGVITAAVTAPPGGGDV